MNAYLLRHAIANVWCNPAQDKQYVYKLARISPRHGVRGDINVFYEKVYLPTPSETYMVYQLGHITPKWVNIPSRPYEWWSLSDLMMERQMYGEVYLDSGIIMPRFECYVRFTQTGNLLVAIKHNLRIHSLSAVDVYLRFYSNAYFQSARSEGHRYIDYLGKYVGNNNDILLFQQEVQARLATSDAVPFYYVNGRFVSNVSLVTAEAGDCIEFILDGSVKRVIEIPIKRLPVFHSKLDELNKYILHYDDPDVNTIEYLDDVDLYLVRYRNETIYSGVSYHRNSENWMRMLTHKDYSIPTTRVQNFVFNHPEDRRHIENPVKWPSDLWTTPNDLYVRMYIRHSGFSRPLEPEANRIQELYRLSSERIINAMVGDYATLDVWRAENLENSPYVRFMSSDPEDVYPITFNNPEVTDLAKEEAQEFAGQVYGYHAAATILAGTPSNTYLEDTRLYADLAYEHWYNATVYEYDKDGLLLGYHHHIKGKRYIARSSDCVRVEAITGQGGALSGVYFGKRSISIPYGYGYRVYISSKYEGSVTGDWIDITELSGSSAFGQLIESGNDRTWVWSYDENDFYGMIRVDDKFLARDLQITKDNGQIRFNIATAEDHNGAHVFKTMDVPFGQLDVFLNGRSLTEGIDYIVQWPEVVISNLEYLSGDHVQRIHYRAYGFCNTDLTRRENAETGFVRFGLLSRNHRYDIHRHKVRRVVVDGAYMDPDVLQYDEDTGATSIVGVRNGAPYSIIVPPVVFRDVYKLDSVARRIDDDIDRRVSEYMTLYYPPVPRPPVDTIELPYHVVSVFSNKIIHDLLEGYLNPVGIDGSYTDMDVQRWCAPYAWLLEYDILNTEFDDEYMEVWPHWFEGVVTLNTHQYQLLVRALLTHLQKMPNLAPFINVVPA